MRMYVFTPRACEMLERLPDFPFRTRQFSLRGFSPRITWLIDFLLVRTVLPPRVPDLSLDRVKRRGLVWLASFPLDSPRNLPLCRPHTVSSGIAWLVLRYTQHLPPAIDLQLKCCACPTRASQAYCTVHLSPLLLAFFLGFDGSGISVSHSTILSAGSRSFGSAAQHLSIRSAIGLKTIGFRSGLRYW